MDASSLLRILGRDLLGYLCSTGADELPESDFLPSDQEALALWADRHCDALSAVREYAARSDLQPRVLLSWWFVTARSDDNTIVANRLHRETGGRAEGRYDDPLLDSLATVARDCFPALLLIPHELALNMAQLRDRSLSGLAERVTQGARRNSRFQEAVTALESEKTVLELAARDPQGGWSAASVIEGALQSGTAEVIARKLQLDPDDFERAVLKNIEDVRRLAVGNSVTGVTVLGLAGLTVRLGDSIETPWGTLHGAGALQRAVRPGLEAIESASTTAVLEIPHEIVLGVIQEDANERRERALKLLGLAALLAANVRPWAIPRVHWGVDVFPTRTGRSVFADRPLRFPQPPAPALSEDELEQLQSWSQRLEDAHTANIEIAISRTLSAVSEHYDYVDALIDAVVAWENLVGSVPETTFRVTAALAYLIEPDANARLGRRRELAKLYGARNEIVHGQRERPKDPNAAQKAIDVAVEALRTLLGRRQDLLELRKSEDRANKLLMGL